MTPNLVPIILGSLFIAIIWIWTTFLCVRIIRRNDNISESAKVIWSVLILAYWLVGILGYLIWNVIWQMSAPKAEAKQPQS